jgi:hypothetical protein
MEVRRDGHEMEQLVRRRQKVVVNFPLSCGLRLRWQERRIR